MKRTKVKEKVGKRGNRGRGGKLYIMFGLNVDE